VLSRNFDSAPMARASHFFLSFLALSTEALRVSERDDMISRACTLKATKGLTHNLIQKSQKCGKGMKVHGAIQQFGDEIDEFLIPFTQWCVTHTSNNNAVLRPLPRKQVPLFEDINRVQFALRDGACDGVVSVSGQFVGAATQSDLKNGFEEWYKANNGKPFVPIWMDTGKPANQTSMHYEEPFCNRSSSPTHLHDCFFLPTSNCIMGAQQWERIRTEMRPFGGLQNVSIGRQVAGTRASGVDLNIMWQMLFFRQNAKTRSELARRERAWRAKNPSWPARSPHGEPPASSAACAALHIRHGDKLTPFWMNTHHTVAGGFNRTLDEYLDEALNLMQRNAGVDVGAEVRIMVMSDDADIIKASMKTKRATTFHVDQKLDSLSDVLQADVLQAPGGFSYGKGGSEDMLQWLLTIRLMSECDVFVGNLGSGFTKFVYHGICEQRQGNCPEAVTLGCGGKEYSELFNYRVSPPSVVQHATC